MYKILVTGSAGFIGFHLTKALLKLGFKVHGIDNLNNYYSKKLKNERLEDIKELVNKRGINKNYSFSKLDLKDKKDLSVLFKKNKFDIVVNLAAQAGVRYSLKNPQSYIDSNIVGFFNLIDCIKENKIKHFLFASSSSVYGMQTKKPFSSEDNTDFPVSLYAASKKTNEILAFSYSHLYKIPTTCMRFFTVYGPYGRPDMAYFTFFKKIKENKVISLFNEGNMKRDFTYIDDVIFAVENLIHQFPKEVSSGNTKASAPFVSYNIGNNKPITLNRFVKALEKASGKKARIKKVPIQAGDVPLTFADIDPLSKKINYHPKTSIEEGLLRFVEWHNSHYS